MLNLMTNIYPIKLLNTISKNTHNFANTELSITINITQTYLA